MAFKGIDREDLLTAIDRTLQVWEGLNFEYNDQAVVLRPLCQNIHQQTKVTTFACDYCPVYRFGFHHVCRSVEQMQVGDTSDAAKREFANIKKLVINGFKSVKKKVEADTTWQEYKEHIKLKKAGAIKSSTVVKKKPEPVVDKRKTYKVPAKR